MTGGSKKKDAANLISRDREIQTLAKELENLKNNLTSPTKNHTLFHNILSNDFFHCLLIK